MRILGIFWAILALFFFTHCGELDQVESENGAVTPVERDLPEIQKDGKLVALTAYSTTSYFIYRGKPQGYEYELLEMLADYLNLELELVIVEDMDQVFEKLNEGKGDIVAYNMTVTKDRAEMVSFTRDINSTRQVLVQRKPDNWESMPAHQVNNMLIRNQIDMLEVPVHVRKNSSYYSRLRNLEQELGGNIDIQNVPGNVSTETLIRKVAEGEIAFTVADENIARINQIFYPNIDIETPVSFPQRIAWAVRQNAPQFQEAVNAWIEEIKSSATYYVLYNKYYENRHAHRRRVQSDFFSLTGSQLTPYDDLLRAAGENSGFDWRILASLMFQESRFDPQAVSWAGAQGVMQLMPATAQRFGVHDPFDPAQSIRAGVQFLEYLDEFWSDHIRDDNERLKFVLASYNVGPGHVADARRLAEKYGHNPDLWFGNTAKYLRKKSERQYYLDEVVKYGYARGEEPYRFVIDILKRFEHYRNFSMEELVSKGEGPDEDM